MEPHAGPTCLLREREVFFCLINSAVNFEIIECLW